MTSQALFLAAVPAAEEGSLSTAAAVAAPLSVLTAEAAPLVDWSDAHRPAQVLGSHCERIKSVFTGAIPSARKARSAALMHAPAASSSSEDPESAASASDPMLSAAPPAAATPHAFSYRLDVCRWRTFTPVWFPDSSWVLRLGDGHRGRPKYVLAGWAPAGKRLWAASSSSGIPGDLSIAAPRRRGTRRSPERGEWIMGWEVGSGCSRQGGSRRRGFWDRVALHWVLV